MRGKKIIGGMVLGAAVLSLAVVLMLRAGGREEDGEFASGAVNAGNKPAVGIIEINGIIVGGRSYGSLFGESHTGSQTVMAQLRQVSRNPNIKAVVLRVNSPGGTPAAAQEITGELLKLKKSGVKVVASMGDVAASGAYWISSVSDRIVASPGTITGSIGVVIQARNYQGLFDKLGVEERTFKSGPYKDMGSPGRPVTGEEIEIFQSMVDDTYHQFVDLVSAGRKLRPEEVNRLKGRVLTGRQAQKAGLVDDLGNFYDAVSLAGEISGLGRDPRVVSLTPRRHWWSFWEEMESSLGVGRIPLTDIEAYPGVLLLCPPVGVGDLKGGAAR